MSIATQESGTVTQESVTGLSGASVSVITAPAARARQRHET